MAASSSAPDDLALLQLAYQEYRAEVQLGWDRQRVFLGLNPLVLGFVAVADTSARALACAAVLSAMVASVAGLLVAGRSHERYQAARAVLQQRESALGVALFATTDGMRAARGEPRRERVRVVTLVRAVLAAYALIDAAVVVVLALS